MSRPTLSVVVCNYNDSDCLGGALEAICEQSWPPDEVLVVDDGSTDNSIELISAYAKRYPMIRLLRNKKNMGIIYSATKGLHAATSEYIYFGAADDRVLPGMFDKSMSLLTQYRQAALCCADILINNFVHNVKAEVRKGWLSNPGYISQDDLVKKFRGGLPDIQPYCFAHTCILKQDYLIDTNAFLPDLKWHADGFSYHVIAFRKGICYIPEPMVLINIEKDSYGMQQHLIGPETEVVTQMIRYLASAQFCDVAPLFRQARAMSPVEMNHVNKVAVMIDLIKQSENRHREYFLWMIYFIGEHLNLKIILPIRMRLRRLCAAMRERRNVDFNQIEQLYAWSFHQYDRIRRLVRQALS